VHAAERSADVSERVLRQPLRSELADYGHKAYLSEHAQICLSVPSIWHDLSIPSQSQHSNPTQTRQHLNTNKQPKRLGLANKALRLPSPHSSLASVTQATILPYYTIDSLSTPITKMPSHLRLQAQFEPVSANATYQSSPTSPPSKKQKMSLTQTYYVASTARSKLGREANKSDHNLRLLVGHANLLDSLMIELSDAERQQEAWFNQSVQKASKPEQPRHVTWIDSIPEVEEEGEEGESDVESDYDEDADEIYTIPLRKVRAPAVMTDSAEIDIDELDSDEEDDDEHALTRVPSSRHSPPELMDCDDSDSDSEEEDSMPSSPESQSFELDEKQREQITTTAFYEAKAAQGLEDYIMQQAQQPQAPLIAAY
jgi:hypothetical protein